MKKSRRGVLYNTAGVIDADGTFSANTERITYRTSGFWEKFFFKPGNLGYPVFQTKYCKVGVYICYDRHFPEGARIPGLNDAEIVYNLRRPLQDCHSIYGNSNSRRMQQLMVISWVASTESERRNPVISESFMDLLTSASLRQIFAQASEDNDELLVAEFDLDMIEEVRSVASSSETEDRRLTGR